MMRSAVNELVWPKSFADIRIAGCYSIEVLLAVVFAGRKMAPPERFELPTNRFEADYSIQLSYGGVG